jgi:hypothetical protein
MERSREILLRSSTTAATKTPIKNLLNLPQNTVIFL